jgi:DNA-binding MarR family transcriptional regulator
MGNESNGGSSGCNHVCVNGIVIPLKPAESSALLFIREFQAKYQSSPRLKNIKQHLGYSRGGTVAVLRNLEKKGYIYFEKVDGVTFIVVLWK